MADQGEFCTECGAAVSSTDKFCAGCGHNSPSSTNQVLDVGRH